MDRLDSSCSEASIYPCNLVDPEASITLLKSRRLELERRAPRLCCKDGQASVALLEMYDDDTGLFDPRAQHS